MKIFKEDLSKKKKIMITISLLFLCFSLIAISVEAIEKRNAELAQQRLEESYSNYESLIIDNLIDIKEISSNIIGLAYSGDTRSYQFNYDLGAKCNTFIDEYSEYKNGDNTIDELHQEVLVAINQIKQGSDLLAFTADTVETSGYVRRIDLDNQFKGLENIAGGANYLDRLIQQIKDKNY